MVKQELSQERCDLIKIEIEKARKKGDFKTEIFLAEQLNFYFHAGEISESHGLFKRAYKNFQKEEKKCLRNKLDCVKKLNSLNKFLSSNNYLIVKEILKNKNISNINQEKCDYGNWNKIWINKVDENLIRIIKKSQPGKFSSYRIKTYN